MRFKINPILVSVGLALLILQYNNCGGTETGNPLAEGMPGSLDRMFGKFGFAEKIFEIENFDPVNGQGGGVVIQPDGKIVVGGMYNGNYMFVRFNKDGSLDNSFSGDGVAIINDPVATAAVNDIKLDSQNRIVAAGWSGQNRASVLRLLPDGKIDTSFQNANSPYPGLIIEELVGNDQAYSLLVLPDNSIVVGGVTNGDAALIKYLENGLRDNSFSDDGLATFDFGGNDRIWAMALDNQGRIVVGGDIFTSLGGDRYDIFVMRVLANGTLDSSFNGTGARAGSIFQLAGSYPGAPNTPLEHIDDIEINATGEIFILGSAYAGDALSIEAYILKMNSSGQVDSTFGSFGGLQILQQPGPQWSRGLSIDNQERLVLTGVQHPNSSTHGVFAARLLKTGQLDTSFGNSSFVTYQFPNSVNHIIWSGDSALQSDGKIILSNTFFRPPVDGNPYQYGVGVIRMYP